MSSSYVRTQIFSFLESNSQETVVDLTAQFGEIKEFIEDNDVEPDSPWLGVQFVGDGEEPVGLAATNDQGNTGRPAPSFFILLMSGPWEWAPNY